MADPKPTRVDEFPLIFDPHAGLKINYFKNLRDEEWSFKKTKPPLHLWQKNVNPTPEGGSVIVDMFAPTKKSAREWSVVRKTPKPQVHEQAWTLLSSDGSSYTLTLDQNQGVRNVLITPGNQRFDVVKLDHEYRMTKDRPEQDAEACEAKMMENIDAAYRDRLKLNKRYIKQVEADEHKQEILIKDSIQNGLLDDDIAYIQDDSNFIGATDEDSTPFGRNRGRKKSDTGDVDIDTLIKQRRVENHEDLDVDAPHGDLTDDEEVMDIDDDEDEELMQELFADIDDLEEEDEDEDEKKKRKKEEKEAEKETPKPPPENVPARTVEEIALSVTGPRNVKEEELVRYFLDVGQATQRQLIGRFKSQLQTPDQKRAFKILIQKKCTLVKRQSGDEVFRLKQRK